MQVRGRQKKGRYQGNGGNRAFVLFFLALTLGLPLPLLAQKILIPFHSTWKYHAEGRPPGARWQDRKFADAGWEAKPAVLGYGNGNEATVISFGPNPKSKYITTYFRKSLHLADTALFSSYTANLKRDDGAVVYVNGVEVHRSNLPAGPVSYATLAATATDDGRTLQPVRLAARAFRPGTNVIAVEVHQASARNADLAFDLELLGHPASEKADRSPPVVLHLLRQEPAAQAGNASTARFRLTFSEPVRGLDAGDLLLRGTGTARGQIQDCQPYGNHGNAYDIGVGQLSGQGALWVEVRAGDTGIRDAAGNSLLRGYTEGQRYERRDEAAALALTRGPYLQMGSSTALRLRWRTDKPTDSRVEVGTSHGAYPLSFGDSALTREHEVQLSSLKPGTRYYYRFGSSTQVLQAGDDNYFLTAPQAGSKEKVRVAVFGDCGVNNNEIQANTLNAYLGFVGQKPADLMLLLGDNAYDDGSDAEYQQHFFAPYGNTILKNHQLFPSPGNHDYHLTSKEERTAPYYKNFSLPSQGESGGLPSGSEAYYAVDWGNIHFISLDSYGTERKQYLYDTLGTQVSWLKKDLAANTRPWVIVFWHHPPYSMGNHNSDEEEHLVRIRQRLLPILERHGVDLVMTGHSHLYERSYLLKNYFGPENSFKASKHAVDTNSARYDGSERSCPYVVTKGNKKQGTVYVVAGSAGQVSYVQPSWPHRALPFTDLEGGMLYLEVEDNRLDARYLRSDGRTWDQFTIMQQVNRRMQVTAAAGSPATLRASWIGNYRWSTGDTTRSITVMARPGDRFQVMDPQACLQDNFELKAAPGIAQRQEMSLPADASPAAPWLYPTLLSRGSPVRIRAPGPARVQVRDLTGRPVLQTSFTGEGQLETSRLRAGLYLVLLQGDDSFKTQKILV
ncbi:MAG: metallophosphoesterase, partial [Adhaeribacter sp.]